jgi:dienelactone hydrolase
MRTSGLTVAVVAIVMGCGSLSRGQPARPGPAPGDASIHAYLARAAAAIEASWPDDVPTAEAWQALRPRYHDEYMDMLGLSPAPARGPLQTTVTGTFDAGDVAVENLHYQSVPHLYVTANLYRPKNTKPGERLPAVLYVCGHAGNGRDGGKTVFQSHGIWLARHGYVCLIVDTLQLGEIPGVHHGTYREERWWWHSRGYTPAGVECWNGVRGIDYLVSRPDVDPDRIAVTGISGGGAATFWIAAADDRVQVAVPVSGMADLGSYVADRVVDGHCDCMFLYNTYQWPWTRIAGLIAPRPLLFVNSDHDSLFPMAANDRVIARLERLYSRFGAGDRVDAVVSMGGHAYRKDIRQSVDRFLNTHLKGDLRPVVDSEVDAVAESNPGRRYPIDTKRLRVFATDADIPAGQLNTTIDRHFVPVAKVELPDRAGFPSWRDKLVADLRRRSFHHLPVRVPPARALEGHRQDAFRYATEEGIEVDMEVLERPDEIAKAGFVKLVVSLGEPRPTDQNFGINLDPKEGALYRFRPRGASPDQWTRKNPPNTVERSHALLGRTVDSGRVWDVAACARILKAKYGPGVPLIVEGRGAAGMIGAYAALLEPDIDRVEVIDPPLTHMDAAAPALLGVLRVLDIPEALGLLAPRPLAIRGGSDVLFERVSAIYDRAGAAGKVVRAAAAR